jgi:GMP synthase (glutamine-hydrolysing)
VSGNEKALAILVAGEPIERVERERGSFADLIRRASGGGFDGPWATVDLRDGSSLPDPENLTGVILTGSAASVTERAPWMLSAEAYLRDLVRARVPTFGICFGHQLLGQALGGRVERNPRGREIGSVELAVIGGDELLPSAPVRDARVNMTHVDTVTALPEGARVICKTEREAHAAVRFGERAWGVQFHPEIDRDVMLAYLEERAELVRTEGGDPEGLIAAVDEGAFGREFLRAFVSTLTPRR